MGIVYRAQHMSTGEVVALKTVAGLRPGMVGSMRREILALVRLRHPGVVRLVGEGLHEGLPWHAMELLEGRPLRTHIDTAWKFHRHRFEQDTTREGGNVFSTTAPDLRLSLFDLAAPKPPEPLPLSERPPAGGVALAASLTIARRICQTLAFLHGEGIVHGDIKPENVVLQSDGKPVLVDFGIMRRVAGAGGREALEVDHDGAGTLAYMAPEQIRAADLDARADLYALGCILYEMVCGRPPFLDDWNGSIYEQQLERMPDPPSQMVTGVAPRLEALILKLLAKRAEERPGYADDVGAELEALGAEPWPEFAQPPPRAYLYRPGFSGRVALLEQLDAELAAAREGVGRCAILTGPSGAGKTRLCIELAGHARAQGMRVLSGECVPLGVGDQGASQPLQAFRPLLQAIADRCRSDGPELSERLLGEHARTLEEIEPALARVPGLERLMRQPPSAPLAEERAGERAQNSVIEVLTRFSALQPLLIILDDLQWADSRTLGVVRALVNRPPGALHALLLVTCRSESGDAALNAFRGAVSLQLRLDPLGPNEVEHIIGGMTALQHPPRSLVEHLTVESGGNPFFVAEYLKTAVADGLLRREHGQWQFRLSAEAPLLLQPGSLQELVARRLDGLSEEARLLVQVGAVLGRSFASDELQAVAGRAVDAGVDELLARQILQVEESGALRFLHDKIRETAYDRMAESERRRWHARAAEVLQQSAQDPAVWRRLAHHYSLAENDARAFEWAERAGKHAHQNGAFREARELLQLACALEPRLPTRPPVERAQLHRVYAESLDNVGDIHAGGGQLLEALAALGRPLPSSRAGWLAMASGQLVRQAWHRLAPEELLVPPEERLALGEAAIAASRLVAYYYFRHQLTEMLASITLAVNLSEAAGADAPHARAGAILGGMAGVMGLTEMAKGYFQRTRDAALRSGDIGAELFQAEVESMYHVHRADWPAARALVNPKLERGAAAGAAFGTEALLLPATLASLFSGDLAGAEAHARRMHQSSRANGHRLHEVFSRTLLGEIAWRRAQPEEALRMVEPSVPELERDGDVVNKLNCMGLIAGARLSIDDLPGALAMAGAADKEIAANPGAAMAPFHMHEHVPSVYLTAWERGDASLAENAKRACQRAQRYARIAAIARPLALRHEARRSLLLGKIRRARLLLEDSLTLAKANGMPFDVEAALALQRPA
jgi:hypothetical protein